MAYSTATNFKRSYIKHGKTVPEERLPPNDHLCHQYVSLKMSGMCCRLTDRQSCPLPSFGSLGPPRTTSAGCHQSSPPAFLAFAPGDLLARNHLHHRTYSRSCFRLMFADTIGLGLLWLLFQQCESN